MGRGANQGRPGSAGRRRAFRQRRRARIDERLAVLRVLEARVRRRAAEATLRALDALESTWDRLGDGRRSGAEALQRLVQKAERLLSRPGDR